MNELSRWISTEFGKSFGEVGKVQLEIFVKWVRTPKIANMECAIQFDFINS